MALILSTPSAINPSTWNEADLSQSGNAIQVAYPGDAYVVNFNLFLNGTQVGGGQTNPITEAAWAALTGATARLKALAAVEAFLGVSGTIT